ncbi:DUF3098 domain-containing protein [Porphyromonas circumdentaria]|uniref:DUF3098 domain-containing protein n=1 Tax=Porphyromonas circumdentaria TaxID=29524 RepID=UPI0026DC04FE|nr:DUF3098 domain-containing protein [Porphyromonas circumdentaria]MDO4721898.1 DUF3098 domain-containing protein [Porphyromonas circumdentaria]
MIFGKKNYILIIASLLLIIFGIILMSGGGSVDGVSFNPDIFSVRRIVVAPIISLLGFLLMIVAIMLPDKNRKGDQE